MTEEFFEDLTAAVQRHSHDLDADDLRDGASKIETIADKWEAAEL